MRERTLIMLFFCTLIALAGTDGFAGKRKTHVIKQGDTPAGVAKRYGVPMDQLLRFNNLSPGKGFRVGKTLEIPKKGEVTGRTYKVRSGDSVAKVADFHGVSQSDLRSQNNMGKNQKLKVGKEILIPMALRGGARRGHVIRKGDTLASIAKKHGIKTRTLMRANKLNKGSRLQLGRTLIIPEEDDGTKPYRPKKTNKLVKSGKKIKGGVRHTVQPGQNLWIIARAYNVKGEKIAKRNGFDKATPLAAGQSIIIPGAREVVPVRVKGFVIEPVTFVMVYNNKSERLRLMKKNGQVSPYARKRLSRLARSRKSGKVKLLDRRLIHMLQRVAERYPGKIIDIVSAYRPGEKGSESQHSYGRAIDFRVRGISNRELYNFCTQLPKSGCGYYPNSVFIHMDVRRKSGTWTDYSSPGEKAKYRKPADNAASETTAD